MASRRIKRALISAFDKTGIVDFARSIIQEFDVEILSTGGTARLLGESGVAVTLIEEITGFPEMMNGRVKTLHPMIHAGILADRDNQDHVEQLRAQGIAPIDMVVVSLYPFENTVATADCTLDQAIEMIDIGGPCMLRAAAKNHRHLVVVSDTAQLPRILDEMRNNDGDVPDDLRVRLAQDAFAQTAAYDSAIECFFAGKGGGKRHEPTSLFGDRGIALYGQLRYGENPHQSATAYRTASVTTSGNPGTLAQKPLGETELSFNNLVDADAALALCRELQTELPGGGTACVFVKHTNACGVGVADSPTEAYCRAYLGDPNAAMGGILACSFPVDDAFATAVMDTYDNLGREAGAGGFFLEVWTTPEFIGNAHQIIGERKAWGKRVRLLQIPTPAQGYPARELDIRKITGGLLAQDADAVGLNEPEWETVSQRSPSAREWNDLRLAWLVCKHTKSNAITICRDGMLLGNGAGQMSRVMSCRIAVWLATENGHRERLEGAVAASDAFFPFRDGPDILTDAGVSAIIQPGGSKRDEETTQACDQRDVALVFTGTRHFKH